MQETTKRVAALAEYNILDTPPEPEFDDIVQIAQRVCRTPVALVSLVVDDRQWFKARIGFSGCETPLAQSVCAYALTSDDLLIIGDLTLDERTKANTLVTGDPFIRFYAGAPLVTPDGISIGSLCVIDVAPRPEGLTPDQAETLRALARQTMIVLTLRKAMAARDTALTVAKEANKATLDRALASEAANTRMQEAEALVKGAQQAARVGSFEVEIALNRFQVSPEFCRIFGLPQMEFFDASLLEDLILLQDRSTVASSRSTRADASAAHDVEYRIRRQNDGALRWISRRSDFAWDEAGEPIRMLGVVQDVTDRKLAEMKSRALITLGDHLRSAATTLDAGTIAARVLGETLLAARAGYAKIDEAQGTYTVESDWASSGVDSLVGTWPSAQFPTTFATLKKGAPLVVANMPAALWLASDAAAYSAAEINAQISVPLVQDDRLIGAFFVHNQTPRTWSASEIDFAVAVADRTYASIAKIKAEEHQRILNEELSHRLKNTLSMVQAIVNQTLRGIEDRGAVKALEDRIITLSKAHDVLLQQSWSAAPISAVVDTVRELHGGHRPAIETSGPDLTMGPKATLSLSLLLHELTTNSIKYGALSVELGRVALTWYVDRNGAEPTFILSWIERGGPLTTPPTRRGFGSRLIGMGLAGAGRAELNYKPEGLHATFGVPLRLISTG